MPANSRWDLIRGFKGLNADLNPICHLLALIGAHHILNVSRIRVKCISCTTCGQSYEGECNTIRLCVLCPCQFYILFKHRMSISYISIIHIRKENWIGHILRRNCHLQRVIEGKIQRGIEVTGRQGRRRRKLLADLKEMILSFEGRSPGLHYVESSLWKRLWTCRKTDY